MLAGWQSYQRTEEWKHTKNKVISQFLLADRVIRGLKMGNKLRVRASASACWMTELSEDLDGKQTKSQPVLAG